ncbi:ribosomal protein L30, ferredoxin-like fold domain-containing protein [Scheffersomyces coipomensis]|uniref:ribosomal protein L30, ferredoxin-like fold domain-containing protein n=1 Tax=Scheffersomyces coipomensis TaxID=1788519 RepID=UPI00315D8400
MAILNSNPEILLRKRKNADRKRIEKQEQAHEKLLKQKRQRKTQQKNKFIRAETLVSNNKSNALEKKRIRNLTKKQQQEQADSVSQSKEDDDDENKLLFIIRIPNHTKGLRIPNKASKILNVLKLTQTNTGVFVKATPTTFSLLNLIAPYIIVGKPSLASIRKLFQKRACILTQVQEDDEEIPVKKIIKLDNNQLVEDQFGEDLGLICIEDLIYELTNLSDNFVSITNWLLPFKLNPPINGWGPQAKLAKLIYKNDETLKPVISLSQDFKLSEVEDIDKIIDQQN